MSEAGTVTGVAPLEWQAAKVVAIRAETPTAKTYRLALPMPAPHRAGQHYVVRLTAPDGYQASRSYSVASAPDEGNEIELTVERLEDGEISSFLHDVVVVGDDLEVRGPIGGWFVWDGDSPALLIGGGSGLVPLMAMLRFARMNGSSDLVHLIVSARTPDNLYYASELEGPETHVVYTRATPPGFPRPAGRLTVEDLEPLVASGATAFVCGSPPFCDGVTELLSDMDFPTERIKVERFGETG